ncbi:ABC transporter substrate-binding protein [bacterium]|nr:ABC transporter substrate-binding protein [candidate division CSSED10-310 bacterium]
MTVSLETAPISPTRAATSIVTILIVLAGLVPTIESNAAPSSLRIVSQVPSLTEILYAMGADDLLAGVTDFCLYPPAAKDKPSIGGIINPDLERLLALRPDLVLLQDTQRAFVEKYEKLGLRTLVVKADSVRDVLDSILLIGRAVDREAAARRLHDSLQEKLARLRRRTEHLVQPSVLVVIGHEPGSLRELYAAAGGSYHDELLTLAGGRNCLASGPMLYAKISKEEILMRSPQVIVVLSAVPSTLDAAREERALWAGLPYLDAVKRNRVHLLGGGYMLVPGPRLTDLAGDLFQVLHPEAEEPAAGGARDE